MKTRKLQIETKNYKFKALLIESTWLLILIRFVGSLGVAYSQTIGTTAIAVVWFIVMKEGDRAFYTTIHGHKVRSKLLNHEIIHLVQQREVIFTFKWRGKVIKVRDRGVVFIFRYVWQWFRTINFKKFTASYKDIAYEAEAFKHDSETHYLMKREEGAWKEFKH